jgi:hypothetical protein
MWSALPLSGSLGCLSFGVLGVVVGVLAGSQLGRIALFLRNHQRNPKGSYSAVNFGVEANIQIMPSPNVALLVVG